MRGPRRPNPTTIEPGAFEAGSIARQNHDIDIPFIDPSDPEAFARVLNYLVEKLDEPDRSCVSACVMKGISYREAAEIIEIEVGRLVDKKTVWRWTQRGVDQLRVWLEATPWVGILVGDRIPLPPSDERVTGDLHGTPTDTASDREQGHG